MHIRPTTTDDRPAVLALVKAAFTPGDDEVDIVEQVWASAGHRSDLDLVAEDGDMVVGHVLVSVGDLDGRPVLGLARSRSRPVGSGPVSARRSCTMPSAAPMTRGIR